MQNGCARGVFVAVVVVVVVFFFLVLQNVWTSGRTRKKESLNLVNQGYWRQETCSTRRTVLASRVAVSCYKWHYNKCIGVSSGSILKIKIQDHFIISSETLHCGILTYITIILTNTANYTAQYFFLKEKGRVGDTENASASEHIT